LYVIAALFAMATFSYACFSTMANVLPADLYHSDAASVSGLGGTGAAIGTIIAFKLIGHLSDAREQTAATHAFDPIVVVAGLVPLIGMILVLLLVRNTEATEQGWVQRI
jgi:ACS family hexuronate transporter-like MFS transporter